MNSSRWPISNGLILQLHEDVYTQYSSIKAYAPVLFLVPCLTGMEFLKYEISRISIARTHTKLMRIVICIVKNCCLSNGYRYELLYVIIYEPGRQLGWSIISTDSFLIQVYLNSTECCRVMEYDTVGIWNERDCPIGYMWDTGTSGGVLNILMENDNVSVAPSVGNTFFFDSLIFPYHFAVGAAYDAGICSGYWNILVKRMSIYL